MTVLPAAAATPAPAAAPAAAAAADVVDGGVGVGVAAAAVGGSRAVLCGLAHLRLQKRDVPGTQKTQQKEHQNTGATRRSRVKKRDEAGRGVRGKRPARLQDGITRAGGPLGRRLCGFGPTCRETCERRQRVERFLWTVPPGLKTLTHESGNLCLLRRATTTITTPIETSRTASKLAAWAGAVTTAVS